MSADDVKDSINSIREAVVEMKVDKFSQDERHEED